MKQRIYFYGSLLLVLLLIAVFVRNPVFVMGQNTVAGLGGANQENLRQHVETLANSVPPRNFAHPQSLDQAAEYIAKKFEEAGLASHMQEFKVGKNTYRNVVARLGPETGEYLVIGAHYDVCDDLPGADDNASGTAGLLELARLLGPLKDKLKRPIELVAYTLEEPPNFGSKEMGSYIHALSMRSAHKNIKLMISLEMIGYFKDESWSQKYPMPAFYLLYPSTGNYIALIARPQEWLVMREVKSLFLSATDLPVRSANVPAFVPGVDLSDQLSYWSLDFPAMMVTDTAFMRNQNYHRAEDLPQTLDFRRMAEVINGVAAIAVDL